MKLNLNAVWRGMPRILALAAIGALNVVASFWPEISGDRGGAWPFLVPLFEQAGRVFLGLAAGDLALRILQPRVDGQVAASQAIDLLATGPALVYLGRNLLAAVILILFVTAARAERPPAAAVPLLPVLKSEQRAWWPDMPLPSALGAQIEQETCITLRHRSCWNPRAELRTSREQGIGLGQLTRTWNKDGSERFDALQELVRSNPRQLAGLSWDNRYDPVLQLRAVVLKGLQDYRVILGAADSYERLAMAKSAYNGGLGGLSSDRRLCAATAGCDKSRWFGHVERTSNKSRTVNKGYGESAFAINRGYVRNVLIVRRVRYLELDRS
jgi:hypothetical protein